VIRGVLALRGLMRGLATPSTGNRETMDKDGVGKPPGELGVSTSGR